MAVIELNSVIKDMAAGPFGSNLKVSCFVDYGFPIIDGANLKGYKVTDNITKFVTKEKAYSLKRSIAKRNDVVVTISGTLGQISYIPKDSAFEEYLCSQRQFRITFDETKVYVPYLVFYFHTYEGQQKILSFANQVGVPALSQPLKNFRSIKIDLPSYEKQKKIASFIETINEKIDLNNKINDNLLQQAQAIYDEICKDCEPIKLESLISVIETGSRPKGGAESKGIPSIGAEKIERFGTYDFSGEKYISEEFFSKLKRGIVLSGDVLLYKDGAYTGKSSMALDGFPHEKCAVNEHVFILRTRDNFAQYFLYFTLSSPSIREKIYTLACGKAAQPGLNQQELFSVEAPIPSDDVLQDFDKQVDPLMHAIALNALENLKLSNLRDSLLPKLMSGEIEVDSLDL